MGKESMVSLTIHHYIWIILFSIFGILFAIYILIATGNNPPLVVFILSAIGTGGTGAIIGGIIGNSLVNFHKALFKVQGQKKR